MELSREAAARILDAIRSRVPPLRGSQHFDRSPGPYGPGWDLRAALRLRSRDKIVAGDSDFNR